MCGIFGIVTTGLKPDFNKFEKSLKFLKHRGPDFDSVGQVDETTILGHARLSIIDLSDTNNQPFSVDDRYTLTYNGEVYNYKEIREELLRLGVVFKTSGDTEVVLQSFITWGDDCVNKFNGMWSFAIYDKQLKRLFCSRDRFGVKPFVYYCSTAEFIFSSEIKPIINYRPEIKKPNYNLIANYCYKSLGAQATETWFNEIYRLQPAHNLVWQNGQLTKKRYWQYPQKVNRQLTFDKAREKFDEIFIDAVKLRMRSDVKVGSTLSSGLDSTSIVGVINKIFNTRIDTFTAYNSAKLYTEKDKSIFKEDVNLDESVIVKELTKEFNVTPHYIEVSFADFLKRLSETIYFLESGHSSPATISIHQVYKEARKNVKVLLEGQGADELLAGYIVDSFPNYLIELFKRGEFVKAGKELRLFIKTYSFKYLLLLYLRSFDSAFLNRVKNIFSGIDLINQKEFSFKYVKDHRSEELEFDQDFNKYLFKQHTSGLVNLLHYGDALSMAEGIECRLPFMDYRLVELAFTLPFDFKLRELRGKYIQRKALEAYIPDYISNSKIKIGFATPLDNLFKNDADVEQVLVNENCGTLFNNTEVKKLLDQHRLGKANHSTILFRILSAKIWYRTFFKTKSITS